MSTTQLDTLIVKHLSDLSLAVKRLDFEIQPRVAKAINALAAKWAKKCGWAGLFEWGENNETLWFAPDEWRVVGGEEDAFYCWFQLDYGQQDDGLHDGDKDYGWLVRLVGGGNGRLGFRCVVDTSLFGGKPNWKKFVVPFLKDIQAAGFSFEERSGNFFLPIRIDHAALIEGFSADDIEPALSPLSEALMRIQKNRAPFDNLMEAAREAFQKV